MFKFVYWPLHHSHMLTVAYDCPLIFYDIWWYYLLFNYLSNVH